MKSERGVMMRAAASLPATGRDVAQDGLPRLSLLLVLAVTLGVRLLHMGSALRSPLTYQPGPDEDFYFRFGQAVAGGGGALTPEFAFMDPAYGYILGLIFKLLGPNLFAVYFLQVLLDTVTAYCIFLIGRELGRPRAGLYAALLYGVTCTAVLFPSTLLKATWVANFMALWVLSALVLLRAQRTWAWFAFGILCGYGVALRSNLLLMTGLAAVLLPWLQVVWSKRPAAEAARRAVILVVGFALPIALLAVRNGEVSKSFSPLPNNGGVVLHQLYNPDNPRAVTWIPKFVNYSHPSEIWRGYSAEAQRRIGRALTPHEVDRYWRGQAVSYIGSHFGSVLGNMFRKLSEFVAYIEVPNNRSLVEERVFSPVLRALPSPFGWLFALGVPGIAILLARDRRAVLLVAPILATMVTVAIFFAEDRFRFHSVPALALGAGLFLDDVYVWIRSGQAKKWLVGLGASLLLGGTSVLLAQQMAQPQVTWDRAIWGYLKMGNKDRAKELALKAATDDPRNAKILEALGYIAFVEERYPDAVEHLRRAIEVKPDSHIARYNLAKALIKTGDRAGAFKEAESAVRLAPLPDYQALVEELSAGR